MNLKFMQIFLLLLICPAISCKDFVDVSPVSTQVADKEVFSNDKLATRTLLAIYPALLNGNASPYAIECLTGLSADELVNYAMDNNVKGIYQNEMLPDNLLAANFWNDAYESIRNANLVYLGCSASDKLDPAVNRQLKGEALVIRSWILFNLANLFGDIPLVLTTDYRVSSTASRTLADSVYEKIIKDLKEARDDLSDDYVGADSKTPVKERIRPNKATACALLARVYLYVGRYNDAGIEAISVINKYSTYSLVPLKDIFLKNSAEAIWQMTTPDDNSFRINTQQGLNFILKDPPNVTGGSALNPSMAADFENGDLRQREWIGVYTDTTRHPAQAFYYPYKYKINIGQDIQEYTMLIRLAELYLIRAEVRAHLGNLSGAIDDINMIRRRAGLSALHPTAAVNQTDVINIIMSERKRELFTEQGHRWFDLKRNGNIDAIMNAACRSKGGVWKNTRQYWPIPTRDLLLNPNLVQNPGYK